jgi:hypothetical protein
VRRASDLTRLPRDLSITIFGANFNLIPLKVFRGHKIMAGFFDIKARKEAAATNGNSKAPSTKENTRLQPWVEK